MWITRRGVRGVIVALLAVLAISGCRRHMARPVKFSQGVRAAYDISCPETRIEVESQRVYGNDRVYVLDACGTKVELEHGLRIPSSLTDIDPLTNAEIAALRQNLTFPHQALTPLVQQEIRVWCHEGDALVQGETPAQCHARLAATIVPLGRGRHARDADEHWFAIGQRVFRAWAELARPPCEHLALTDTPAACECPGAQCTASPKRAPVVKRRKPADTLQPEASFPELYGRLELGLGYARLSVAENPRHRGLGIVEAAFLGVALAPQLTLTAGISGFNGLAVHPYSRTVCTDGFACGAETGKTDLDHLAVWFRSNVYPFGSRLHLDAGAGLGLGLQRFILEESPQSTASPARLDVRGGPALSLGAGYEELIGNRWYFGLGGRQIWFVGSELKGAATEGFVTLGMRID